MTRRQRIQAAKSSLLDDLAGVVESWDPEYFDTTADAVGVDTDDVEAAARVLADQLYAWALRLSPAV